MRRRNSRIGFGIIFIGAIFAGIILLAGGLGTMLVLGMPLESLAFWRTAEEEEPRIELPINIQPLVAYERVRREDLINPATGRFATLPIPLDSAIGMRAVAFDSSGEINGRVESVEKREDGLVFTLDNGQSLPSQQITSLGGAFLNPTDIVGRVLRRDKRPGLAFSEAAFFEQGTPAGLAGATPPGMRALTLQASRLTGVHRVSQGEQIDLVANVPLNRLERFELATSSRLPGAQLVASSNGARRDTDKETTARLVASQAVVLTPVTQRVESEKSSSLTQGSRVLAVPVEEVVLAVAAEDVSAVTASLELEATINVLVRSGRPDADDSDRRPKPEGTVAVPIPGKSLLAYQSIDSNVFQEAATGYIRYAYLPEESVKKANYITELNDFIGRVPNRDLRIGQPIAESSLMPIGTPIGLEGATPPGRVLLFLDRDTLVGSDAFGFSQHLDIVASIVADSRSTGSGLRGTQLSDSQRTRVEPIADDVIVVLPTRSPANPTFTGDSDEGGQLILAVRPEQVGQIQFAVSTEASLRATVRPAGIPPTSRPSLNIAEQNIDVESMGFNPLEGSSVGELFVDGNQQRVLFRPKARQ